MEWKMCNNSPEVGVSQQVVSQRLLFCEMELNVVHTETCLHHPLLIYTKRG